jgi:hypothetical protein
MSPPCALDVMRKGLAFVKSIVRVVWFDCTSLKEIGRDAQGTTVVYSGWNVQIVDTRHTARATRIVKICPTSYLTMYPLSYWLTPVEFVSGMFLSVRSERFSNKLSAQPQFLVRRLRSGMGTNVFYSFIIVQPILSTNTRTKQQRDSSNRPSHVWGRVLKLLS